MERVCNDNAGSARGRVGGSRAEGTGGGEVEHRRLTNPHHKELSAPPFELYMYTRRSILETAKYLHGKL